LAKRGAKKERGGKIENAGGVLCSLKAVLKTFFSAPLRENRIVGYIYEVVLHEFARNLKQMKMEGSRDHIVPSPSGRGLG